MALNSDQANIIILALCTIGFIIALAIPQWNCQRTVAVKGYNLYQDCAKGDGDAAKMYLTIFSLLIVAAIGAAFATFRSFFSIYKGDTGYNKQCSILHWILTIGGAICGNAAVVLYASNVNNWSLLIATASAAVLTSQAIRTLLSDTC